jgi:septal ring-binding cell division protein DamX
MPDLNLVDDGGLEESSTPVSAPTPVAKRASGGGGNKTVLIVLLLLVIAAVAIFFLNKRGVIKLWGKKPVPVVADLSDGDMPTEQMPADGQEAPPPTANPQTAAADTAQVALLETPPVDEYTPVPQNGAEATKPMPGRPGMRVEPAPAKPEGRPEKPGVKQAELPPVPAGSSKLTEMKGEFTIQVTALREQTKAEKVAGNLVDAGYPAYIEKVPMKGADWFTVRIGKYTSRDDAKKAVETFGEQIRSHYVIDKVRAK